MTADILLALAAALGFAVGLALGGVRRRDPPFFRQMDRRGRMPFRVISTLHGRPVMMDACVGRDIGQTVHEIAYGAEWDQIVVDQGEDL